MTISLDRLMVLAGLGRSGEYRLDESEQVMWFTEICAAFGVPEELAAAWTSYDGAFPEDWLAWQDHNDRSAMQRILAHPGVREISQIALSFKIATAKVPRNMAPAATVGQVEEALNGKVKVFRGGTGTYNPELTRDWYSYTLKKQNALNLFAIHGLWDRSTTRMAHAETHEQHWVVSLELPVKHVLYYNRLNEGEVIVPVGDARRSKVIVQT